MKTLLILTAGQTDVQLVIDGMRYEIEPKRCGVLHDEIERRSYRVVDPPDKSAQRKDMLPDGDLLLCTPKLDATLRYCDEDSPPTAAIIFDTRRTLDSDPRFAGAVLERRLKQRGINVACRHPLLAGQDRQEDPNHPQDAVVRREVVQGIAEVLARELVAFKPDKVVVATTGGLLATNATIEELVRLHIVGNAKVEVLEIADGLLAGREDRAIPERFHPAAGFRARWHALSLIEKGNLLGAWGAVSHLENEPGQEWTRVVKWLAHFASSLPMPPECDITVLTHQRMAVRAALRVELALRAGDIPRAVHGTVAFFEAALWDHLGERIARSTDPARRRYFKVIGDAPTGNKLLRISDQSDDDRKRPFELKESIDGISWYWVYDGDGGPAARLAKYFLKKDALVNLDKALGSSIRELRNDASHNEPTPELMNAVRCRSQAAALWSTADTFLSESLIQDVLKELGVDEPGDLLQNLLSTIRKRLTAIMQVEN